MSVDFEELLSRWDSMFLQTVDPTRSDRIEAILDVLGTHVRVPLRVLYMGTGPGPLAGRILRRFKGSQIVAVDSDPVLLRVGEQALWRYGSRITWILADLREKDWSYGLTDGSFDAAVSSLALHWLEEREIRSLYRDLRRLLRPQGLLVNGDFLPIRQTGGDTRGGGTKVARVPRSEKGDARVRAFKPKWEKWWRSLEKESSMSPAFSERCIWMPGTIPPRKTSGPRTPVTLESHERALRNAGFSTTTVTWERRSFHVLVGSK